MNTPTDAASLAELEEAFCTRCSRTRPTEMINGTRRFTFHRIREDGQKCNGSYAIANDRLMAAAAKAD